MPAPRTLLSLAVSALFANPSFADEASLDEVVVTAPRMREPLTVELDPKAPQQPVPANDGASFLKNVPGFNVIRKSGTDGDPVLRGLAGSRLHVLMDGSELMGGCGMRMDPPTAYVFPETFDKITVIKGPQSVVYGSGNLAGVVLFEHDPKKIARGVSGFASVMAGAWGRLDGTLSATAASEKGYLQATANYGDSNDYKDADGNTVHSFYTRKSVNTLAGWMPDANTRVEVSAVGSRAEAAYADRGMDGAKFDREGYGVKFEKKSLSPLVQKISAQAYYNYIDHVMDNYSLRTKAAPMFHSMNPDRETQGVRLAADLAVAPDTLLTLGMDRQDNVHTIRQFKAAVVQNIEDQARVRDMDSSTTGVFGELRRDVSNRDRVIGGLRYDAFDVQRYATIYDSTPFGTPDPTRNASTSEGLTSGFARYEHDLQDKPVTLFIGLGHAQRPMDYWEATTYNGLTASDKRNPEKSTQLDAGALWQAKGFSASVSAFYGQVADYILTYAPTSACATSGTCQSLNVDATRWGGEADLAWRFMPRWTLRGTVAYVRAENDSMNVPLAQTPPLEGRVGLDYTTGSWTFGGTLRMVAEQDRVHVSYGNVVGQDLGRTAGFSTLALNAAYKPSKKVLIAAGVDNVFDTAYAEHISRAGSTVAGYTTATRVNEPGRFVWAKLNLSFD